MKFVLAIALGGATGAVLRHLTAQFVQQTMPGDFPWGILAVNIIGCAIMGALVESFALAWSPSAAMRAFLTVGMLGALTTFSAFSVDVVLMIERGAWAIAGGYIVASVLLSVGAMLGAMAIVRGALV